MEQKVLVVELPNSGETPISVTLPEREEPISVELPKNDKIIQVSLPNSEDAPISVELPLKNDVLRVYLPGEEPISVELPGKEDIIQVELPKNKDQDISAGNTEPGENDPKEEFSGVPWVPEKKDTIEPTPKTLNFQELAEKLEGKEIVFVEMVIEAAKTDKTLLDEDRVRGIYQRLNEALQVKRDGKTDYYAETRVIGLFNDLKLTVRTQYGQLMENLGREFGLTEAVIDSFREDTMVTAEHQKNLKAYLEATKKGEVLQMYEGFLQDLEKIKNADGKYDLKQLSPLALYLLTLASTRMAIKTEGVAEQSQFAQTIITDPVDVSRTNLAAEALSKLTDRERVAVLALHEKIKKEEDLSPEDKELRKKYAEILDVKISRSLPVERGVEATTADEIILPPNEKPIGKMNSDELKIKTAELIGFAEKGKVSEEVIKTLADICLRRKVLEGEYPADLMETVAKNLSPDEQERFNTFLMVQKGVEKKEEVEVKEEAEEILSGDNGKRRISKKVWGVIIAGLMGISFLLGAGTQNKEPLQVQANNAPPVSGPISPTQDTGTPLVFNPIQPMVDSVKQFTQQMSQAEAQMQATIDKGNEAKQQLQSNPQPPAAPEVSETEAIEVKIGHGVGEYKTAGDTLHVVSSQAENLKNLTYQLFAQWDPEKSREYWFALEKASGIRQGSQDKPWDTCSNLPEDQVLKFTPEVLKAAEAMFE